MFLERYQANVYRLILSILGPGICEISHLNDENYI